MRQAVRGILVAAICTVAGCRTWQSPVPLSAGKPVVRGQLVITTDFALNEDDPLLKELEAQREDIAETLQLPTSTDPVHVCLFGTPEKYHAFIKARYPGFPDRRAFFVETNSRLMVYAHWNDRVAEDLRHEVAHGYLHSIVRDLPLWVDEGLAEYFEVPAAAQGLNSPHVELLLTSLKENRWHPDIGRLERLNSPDAMTQLDYAESWAWVHFLLHTEPARREAIQAYLAGLRKGLVAPLSLVVRQMKIGPNDLINHLAELNSPKPPSER